MIYYEKGKKYITVDELAKIFSLSYGANVTPNNVYQLCFHYKLQPLYIKRSKQSGRFVKCGKQDCQLVCFAENDVSRMRTMSGDFVKNFNRVVRGKFQNTAPKIDNSEEKYPAPPPLESDMDYANKQLLAKYQEECRQIKKVIISENQRNLLFFLSFFKKH